MQHSLAYQMGLGRDRFDEELGAWSSDFQISDSKPRHLYQRQADTGDQVSTGGPPRTSAISTLREGLPLAGYAAA